MGNRNFIAEPALKTFNDLCRQCYLWYQQQNLLACFHCLSCHPQVNLCLTAAGYSLQQKSFLMRLCNSTADSLNSLTLLVCQMQTFLQLRPVGIAVAQNTLLTPFAPAFLT